MSNCGHQKTTIDLVCVYCGYDLIVDSEKDKIRKQERERIIKLLEERTGYGDSEWDADVLAIIALIKGEVE